MLQISFDDAVLIAHALARFEGSFTEAEMPALERFADALDAKERWLAMFPPAAIVGPGNRVVAFAGKGR
jgi:hypothetical protein